MRTSSWIESTSTMCSKRQLELHKRIAPPSSQAAQYVGMVTHTRRRLLPALGLLSALQSMQISFDLLKLLLAIFTRQIQLLLGIFVVEVFHPTHRHRWQWPFPLFALQSPSKSPSRSVTGVEDSQVARLSLFTYLRLRKGIISHRRPCGGDHLSRAIG